MQFSTAELLNSLVRDCDDFKIDERPWGTMAWLGTHNCDLTVKHIRVKSNARTSMQYHEQKDELLIILDGTGYVLIDDNENNVKIKHYGIGLFVRIKPGTHHRVVGPLRYLEISTYDDNTDTIKLEDDYGRA